MSKNGLKTIFGTLLVFVLVVVIGLTVKEFKKKPSKEKKTDYSKEIAINHKMQDVIEPKKLPERRMSIIMAGDTVIHNGVFMDASKNKTYKSTDEYDFAKMFTRFKPILKKYV
jgi:hypothetical protein